jgi:uncharacterized protein (TIGR02466 family)
MAFKLDRIDTIFPIPLWRYTVQDHEQLNLRLMEEIKARLEEDKGLPNRTRKGWQSLHDFFDRTEPAHAELAAIVKTVLADALSKVSTEIKSDQLSFRQNGWVNVTPPQGYIGPHVHPSALISGTYYVQVPQDGGGGGIEFVSPHPVGGMTNFIKAQMLSDKVRVQPKAGSILLFPGQLLHWVLPNDSDQDRVSISFNLAAKLRPGAKLA